MAWELDLLGNLNQGDLYRYQNQNPCTMLVEEISEDGIMFIQRLCRVSDYPCSEEASTGECQHYLIDGILYHSPPAEWIDKVDKDKFEFLKYSADKNDETFIQKIPVIRWIGKRPSNPIVKGWGCISLCEIDCGEIFRLDDKIYRVSEIKEDGEVVVDRIRLVPVTSTCEKGSFENCQHFYTVEGHYHYHSGDEENGGTGVIEGEGFSFYRYDFSIASRTIDLWFA